MSDENALREDISFLRQLAESGRKGPILGGIFLAGAGFIFGAACLIDLAMTQHWLPFQLGTLTLWGAAGGVFALFWLAMVFRMLAAKKPAALSTNSMFGAVWSACAVGVMVVFLTTLMIAHDMQQTAVLAAYIPVIFAFYGTAWSTCGAVAKRRWMYVAGAGSYLFAFVIALVVNTAWVSLAMGAGLILLLSVPGLKLVQDETAE